MPFSVLGRLAAVLAPLFQWAAARDRRQLAYNVNLVYGLPAHSTFAQMFARQVFPQQILIALETMRLIRRPELIELSGFEELAAQVRAAEAAGLGHVMVTAHLGSWELCAYYAQKAAQRPLHVLAKPAKRRFLTLFLVKLRQRLGVNVLWTDRKTLLREMLAALKRGESLGFVMDQKPEGRQGPQVPFLGQPTEFVSGPATMAIRSNGPVIGIFCLREGPGRYRLVSRTLLPPHHGQKDEAAVTATLAAAISNVIREYPEQWTWTYKRWRSAAPRLAIAAR